MVPYGVVHDVHKTCMVRVFVQVRTDGRTPFRPLFHSGGGPPFPCHKPPRATGGGDPPPAPSCCRGRSLFAIRGRPPFLVLVRGTPPRGYKVGDPPPCHKVGDRPSLPQGRGLPLLAAKWETPPPCHKLGDPPFLGDLSRLPQSGRPHPPFATGLLPPPATRRGSLRPLATRSGTSPLSTRRKTPSLGHKTEVMKHIRLSLMTHCQHSLFLFLSIFEGGLRAAIQYQPHGWTTPFPFWRL